MVRSLSDKNLGKGLYALNDVSILKINRIHGSHLKPYFTPQHSHSTSESAHQSISYPSMLDLSSAQVNQLKCATSPQPIHQSSQFLTLTHLNLNTVTCLPIYPICQMFPLNPTK